MHEQQFAEAVRPRPAVSLGVPLLTYTIGHEILLYRYENPFVTLNRDAFEQLPTEKQIAALTGAVTTCSRTWRESLRGGWFIPRVRIEAKKHRLWRLLFRPSTINSEPSTFIDWPIEIADFRNYLDAARTIFPAPDPDADHACAKANGYESSLDCRGRSFGAPLVAQLINFCLERPALMDGVTTVYDLPYALIAGLYFARLEIKGSVRIENHDEYRVKLQLAPLKAKRDRLMAEARAAAAAGSPPSEGSGVGSPKPSTSGLATEIPAALK